jgi:hypothetical protein
MDGDPSGQPAEDGHQHDDVGLPAARLRQRASRCRRPELAQPDAAPDRKALEKAAKLLAVQTRAQDMMAEAASEGDERITALSSRVTDVRGYPAIIAESKRTSSGKASFVIRSDASRCNCLIIERRAGRPDDPSVEPSLQWIAAAGLQ